MWLVRSLPCPTYLFLPLSPFLFRHITGYSSLKADIFESFDCRQRQAGSHDSLCCLALQSDYHARKRTRYRAYIARRRMVCTGAVSREASFSSADRTIFLMYFVFSFVPLRAHFYLSFISCGPQCNVRFWWDEGRWFVLSATCFAHAHSSWTFVRRDSQSREPDFIVSSVD